MEPIINNNLDKLDEMEAGQFDYLVWWEAELQTCFCDSDLAQLYEDNRDRIDENMNQLFYQRRDELLANPVERIRNGELLKIKGTGGVYHAIHLLAGRND